VCSAILQVILVVSPLERVGCRPGACPVKLNYSFYLYCLVNCTESNPPSPNLKLRKSSAVFSPNTLSDRFSKKSANFYFSLLHKIFFFGSLIISQKFTQSIFFEEFTALEFFTCKFVLSYFLGTLNSAVNLFLYNLHAA
jgi:hypothetical protein